MKWCVSFPEEEILLVRPCLVAICMGNRPAAKLLSVLLYRYSIRQEHKDDAENINAVKIARGEKADQDTSFRIYRTQAQLVKDMCGELVEKTLHDVAIPTLQLLGYLDIDESPIIHCYEVHLDVVIQALNAYRAGYRQLEKVLIAHLQLEKFLIELDPQQLEKFPMNKKNFQLALEKVLIANRKSSYSPRGRKPRLEATGEGNFQLPKIRRDTKDSKREYHACESDGIQHTLPQVVGGLPPKRPATRHLMLVPSPEVQEASGTHAFVSFVDQPAQQQPPRRPNLAENDACASSVAPAPSRPILGQPRTSEGHSETEVPPHFQPSPKTAEDQADSNSYSQSTTADPPNQKKAAARRGKQAANAGGEDATPADQPGQGERESASGKRPARRGSARPKPKEEPIDPARIERVFVFFDSLAREFSGKETFSYGRTKKSTDAIKAWLKSKPTEKLLRKVFHQLWNEPKNPQSGFWWREHMKIHLVLAEYDNRVLLLSDGQEEETRKRQESRQREKERNAALYGSQKDWEASLRADPWA